MFSRGRLRVTHRAGLTQSSSRGWQRLDSNYFEDTNRTFRFGLELKHVFSLVQVRTPIFCFPTSQQIGAVVGAWHCCTQDGRLPWSPQIHYHATCIEIARLHSVCSWNPQTGMLWFDWGSTLFRVGAACVCKTSGRWHGICIFLIQPSHIQTWYVTMPARL